jgi:hypothetical protein
LFQDGLHGKTIFDIKNKKGNAPYSATLFVSEQEPLFPKTVIKWLDKLSLELFGKKLQHSFADEKIYNNEYALATYEEGSNKT